MFVVLSQQLSLAIPPHHVLVYVFDGSCSFFSGMCIHTSYRLDMINSKGPYFISSEYTFVVGYFFSMLLVIFGVRFRVLVSSPTTFYHCYGVFLFCIALPISLPGLSCQTLLTDPLVVCWIPGLIDSGILLLFRFTQLPIRFPCIQIASGFPVCAAFWKVSLSGG